MKRNKTKEYPVTQSSVTHQVRESSSLAYQANYEYATTPKPFIKWAGGKRQLLPDIQKNLPPIFTYSQNITYIEPFVGGGAVLFCLLERFPNITKAIINDINGDLTTTYTVIRDNPNELIDNLSVLQKTYQSLKSHEEQRAYYLAQRKVFNTTYRNDIETASLVIFLNRTCFNGLYRVNSKGKFNVPSGRYSNPNICDAETIFTDSRILQRVEILRGDFEHTINKVSGDVFVYLDPPYKPLWETSSFNTYAKEKFDDADQIRLHQFCQKLDASGFLWMLSNSDLKGKNSEDVFFDNLYADFHIQRVYATRMINANPDKRGHLTELLITNYRPIQPINRDVK